MKRTGIAARLNLGVLGRTIRIDCRTPAAYELLSANFSSLSQAHQAHADLEYSVGLDQETSRMQICRAGQAPLTAQDDGEFLFLFEKDLTIEIERQRRDLYFIHAAALEVGSNAVLLVAPSGKGKSTTAWGLLHHGFRYLSDELAPVELETMRVFPYPHALCLKSEPPENYSLPTGILRTARTVHVPTHSLNHAPVNEPVPLAAMIFLEYRPGSTPDLQAISKAEAAARLFAQALNPLAHSDNGLGGAIAIAMQLACYKLRSGDLGATCELLAGTLSSRTQLKRPVTSSAPESVRL